MKIQHVFVGLLGLLTSAFVACAPAASAPAKTGTVKPVGNLSAGSPSQVSGSFTVSADSPKSKVTVKLSNLEPNSKHAGHIHVGTCGAVGPVAVGLNAITADANGNGSASTEVETAKLAGSVYIAYHQRGPDDANGIGSFVACGEIK